MDEYDGRQFVGIDLHRRRSVIVRHRSYRHNPHFPRKHHARILLPGDAARPWTAQLSCFRGLLST